jgi:hypothetical protein
MKAKAEADQRSCSALERSERVPNCAVEEVS